MNVLWLDDAPERTKRFRSYAPYATLTETAQECIDALAAADEPWDIVFLDHDLGGEIYVDTAEKNTGSEVVRWIGENEPQILKIVVHSCNPEAAKWMVHDLIRLGYDTEKIPITTLLGLTVETDGQNLLEVILEKIATQ